MTPKEKAIELTGIYLELTKKSLDRIGWFYDIDVANQCALIAVDEILDLNLGLSNCDENNWDIDKFYLEVKKEIEKL
jgi:hypothetical protein